MKEYQYIAILKVFFIYIIALIPTWIMLFQKKNYSDKKSFLKINYLCIFLEIIIFSLIYLFPKNIISLFSSKTNIQNYMIYSLKILFIASSTTVIHYTIPKYFCEYNKKNEKFSFSSFFLLIVKLLYIPIMFIGYLIFNTKGALFAVPLCDLLYNIFIISIYKHTFKINKTNKKA